jgi:hypothetical protein
MRRILFTLAVLLSPTIAGAQYLQQSIGFGTGGYGVGQSFAPVGGLGTCGVGAALDTVGYGTCGNVGQAIVVPQQAIVQQEYIQQAIPQQAIVQAPVVVQRAVPVYINRGFGVGGYGINRGFGLGSGVGYGLNSGYGLGVQQNLGLGFANAGRIRGVQRFHQGRNGRFRSVQRLRGRR